MMRVSRGFSIWGVVAVVLLSGSLDEYLVFFCSLLYLDLKSTPIRKEACVMFLNAHPAAFAFAFAFLTCNNILSNDNLCRQSVLAVKTGR